MKKYAPTIIGPSDPLMKAIEAYRSGGVIAYPTETFYGLGVDPFNPAAVERLFELKERDRGKPISLLVRDRDMLKGLVAEFPDMAETLIEKHWPGPLTIVFKAAEHIPETITAGTGSIGIRQSSCMDAVRLVAAMAAPLTATSANPSGKPAATSPEQIVEYFGAKVDVIIDGGTLPGNSASTVVDITAEVPKILRPGAIPESKLT